MSALMNSYLRYFRAMWLWQYDPSIYASKFIIRLDTTKIELEIGQYENEQYEYLL